MNKRLKFILFFFLFAFGSLTMWLTTNWLVRGQSRQNTPMQMPQPYAQVDEKASAVKGADEGAIRELADAVLQLMIADRVPSVLVHPYKEQIVRAEINYRSGLKQGVPEANIVRVIEELARKLSAPDYARTDEVEVHDTAISPLLHDAPFHSSSTSAGREKSHRGGCRIQLIPLCRR